MTENTPEVTVPGTFEKLGSKIDNLFLKGKDKISPFFDRVNNLSRRAGQRISDISNKASEIGDEIIIRLNNNKLTETATSFRGKIDQFRATVSGVRSQLLKDEVKTISNDPERIASLKVQIKELNKHSKECRTKATKHHQKADHIRQVRIAIKEVDKIQIDQAKENIVTTSRRVIGWFDNRAQNIGDRWNQSGLKNRLDRARQNLSVENIREKGASFFQNLADKLRTTNQNISAARNTIAAAA